MRKRHDVDGVGNDVDLPLRPPGVGQVGRADDDGAGIGEQKAFLVGGQALRALRGVSEARSQSSVTS